jgi:hypothetical protein
MPNAYSTLGENYDLCISSKASSKMVPDLDGC